MYQVMDTLAVQPAGLDTVDDDPWTGWPSSTSQREGGGSSRKRILIPYNGSVAADCALEVAAEWCDLLAAEAWVLYVRPWDPVRGGCLFLETPADARAVAHGGVATLRGLGVAASAIVRDASRRGISDTIVAVAEALAASSIVIGSPGTSHAHADLVVGEHVVGGGPQDSPSGDPGEGPEARPQKVCVARWSSGSVDTPQGAAGRRAALGNLRI